MQYFSAGVARRRQSGRDKVRARGDGIARTIRRRAARVCGQAARRPVLLPSLSVAGTSLRNTFL